MKGMKKDEVLRFTTLLRDVEVFLNERGATIGANDINVSTDIRGAILRKKAQVVISWLD
jgi:hypothetical protein